ncbi:MAG: hypothetical protein O3A46_17495 [Candidatus Poribacteria bacterium]|nr:hypothetical protein [Candidatus Poribacteria bacterium]
MGYSTLTVERRGGNDATSLFRQHFADFYGDLSPQQIERLVHAERDTLEDVADRIQMRRLLESWRDDADAQAATRKARTPVLCTT